MGYCKIAFCGALTGSADLLDVGMKRWIVHIIWY